MKTLILSSTLAASVLAPSAFSAPSTLLDLTNANWPAARLSNSVLIIVDAQREYAEGKIPLTGIHEAVDHIATLLARARAAGTPVIHVVQHSPKGRTVFDLESPMAEEFSALTPINGEVIVPKQLPNSFAGTTLDQQLKQIGRKDLIVVGFMTHMCISATVRAALDHGYRSTVVAECCATRDLPDGTGGVITAAEIHRIELAALRDRFATIVSTPDAILE
ncbi:MAG: cysteine hydrolase family protein [Nibricoccus sp.]